MHDIVREFDSQMMEPTSSQVGTGTNDFKEWFIRFLVVHVQLDLPENATTPDLLVDYIDLALELRRDFLPRVKTAFSAQGQALPRWVYPILKLGRYAVASKALLKLAAEMSSLFNPMLVETVTAPPKTLFSLWSDAKPLDGVLRRVCCSPEEAKDYTSRLARLWDTRDAERCFREACELELPVHAEMQLLGFYDQNPGREPTFRFLGVSKKTCFLCQQFLIRHPRLFSVSSSHQKLYPRWRPPPSAEANIYRRYRNTTKEVSQAMETVAKEELLNRLGVRRPVNMDSTAGVSLFGLEFSQPTNTRTQDGAATTRETSTARVTGTFPVPCITSSSQAVSEAGITPPDEDNAGPSHKMPTTTDPIFEMVFHVKRAGDDGRQDIISLQDLLVSGSENAWLRLLKMLRDESGVGFTDGDSLLVDGRIRVANARQFKACLQYLQNAAAMNVEIYVHSE